MVVKIYKQVRGVSFYIPEKVHTLLEHSLLKLSPTPFDCKELIVELGGIVKLRGNFSYQEFYPDEKSGRQVEFVPVMCGAQLGYLFVEYYLYSDCLQAV